MQPPFDIDQIFSDNKRTFDEMAIQLYEWQIRHNDVYRSFVHQLFGREFQATCPEEIPFLPIAFFKTHKVISGLQDAEQVFRSSGTTGTLPSCHHVVDLSVYRKSLFRAFSYHYGNPADYTIFALLPGYVERHDSSLVYMVRQLMKAGNTEEGGFFLDDFEGLASQLKQTENENRKAIFIGVSHALLSFAARHPMNLTHTIVMETGGMKGKGKELTRMELHHKLIKAFRVRTIHSEYGMTELLSQAYSKEAGKYSPPPWMKVFARDVNDPLKRLAPGEQGALDIIDLANTYSCAFISTDDLGIVHTDGTFKITGRLDTAGIRGCNLLFAG